MAARAAHAIRRIAIRSHRVDRQGGPKRPTRDFEVTTCFYEKPGFADTRRDDGGMILKRGDLLLVFRPHPERDPVTRGSVAASGLRTPPRSSTTCPQPAFRSTQQAGHVHTGGRA
ncbi:hypothetical protein [Burkholderia sp. LMG 13014]|uniref:hypothetical protein n=1 Tax=Burkholderia sp. LMG 13014 TaxID=2709306 RepID=UPI001F06D252|nr:hypothetical protein [Burkholderia sp. LMG 13014]